MNRPTTADSLDFILKLMADLNKSIAENTRALAAIHDDTALPWIVMSSHELPMAYTQVNGAWGNVKHTTVVKATRFASRREADVVAAHTHDGTGEPFVSVHILYALQRAVAREQEMLAGIEKVLPQQPQAEETPK
jgi:hypothetical protein